MMGIRTVRRRLCLAARAAMLAFIAVMLFALPRPAAAQYPPPPVPTGLTAAAGNGQITLAWTNESSEVSYNVYRGTTSGGEQTPAVYQIPYTQSSCLDTPLTNGQTYYYYITATNGYSESAHSIEVSVTPYAPGPPPTPTGVRAVGGNALITLYWNASSNTTTYKIYRSSQSGGEDSARNGSWSCSSGVLSLVDSPVTNGQTEYYKVVASNSYGDSAESAEASATPGAAPPAPTGVSAVGGNQQITVSWNAAPGAASYEVYRSSQSGGEDTARNGAWTWTGVQSFVDTGLTNGQTEYYKVVASNNSGDSPESAEASAAPAPAPPAPTGLTATAGNDQVSLTWNAVAGATSYNVYRGDASNTESPTPIASATSTSYTDTGVTAYQPSYYEVTAVNASGESLPSSEAEATPYGPPGPPGTLTASPGDGQIYLSWGAATGAAGYNIMRLNYDYTWATIASGYVGTNYTDKGLVNGTSYTYAVVTEDPYGTAWSNDVSATPLPPPSAPTGLTAVAETGQINLSWNAVAGNPTYSVERSTTSGGPYMAIGACDGTTYPDTEVSVGTTYYYVVIAVNSAGGSSNSNEASATAIAAPPPTGLTATAGDQQVALNWTGVSGVTYYQIWRSQNGSAAVINTVSGTSYVDTGLTDGLAYTYYLTSDVNGIDGPPSNSVSATPSSPPPGNLTATAGPQQVTLNWIGVNGVTYYQIWRSQGGAAVVINTVSGTSYVDTGLTNGLTYTYYLTSNVDGIDGSPSNSASATPYVPPPPAPTGLAAIPGNSSVSVSWNAVSGATSYKIYRGDSYTYTTIVIPCAGAAYQDTGLTNGVTYSYQVSALNSGGEGPESGSVSAIPEAEPPAPTGLTAVPGSASVTLTWTAAPGAASYNVKRASATGGPYTVIQTGITATSWIDTGLTNGDTYYYVVSASNTGGESPNSNEASATPQPLPGPTGLTAVGGANSVSLTWTAESGATSYSVKRASVSGGPYGTISTGLGAPSFLDTGLTNGTTYYYVVSAFINGAETANSNEASAAPQAPPPAPTGLSVASGDQKLTVTWNASAGATSYTVYRGQQPGGETFAANINTTSYTDQNLTDGITYYYEVIAFNGGEGSAMSPEVHGVPLATPTNLTASAGDTQVVLTWSEASGAASYNIYRSTTPGPANKTMVGSSTTTGYTDTGLTDLTAYYYTVTAASNGSESDPSNEATATPDPPINPPTNLIATPADSQVTLNWSDPLAPQGTQYRVFMKTAETPQYDLIANTIVTGTSTVFTGLTNGTTYDFHVIADENGALSPPSNEASATPDPPPSPVTGLTATPGDAEIQLKWNAANLATSYNIYRGTPGQEVLVKSGVTVTTSLDTGLKNGYYYYYVVTGVNASGEGARSNEVDAKPQAAPPAPTGLAAVAGDGVVSLTWSASPNATSYQVYRGAAAGQETTVLLTVAATNCQDTTVVNGTMYWYVVTALDGIAESGKSNEVSAQPVAVPSGLTAVPGDTQVTLNWQKSTGATGYKIYRSDKAGQEADPPINDNPPGTTYTDTDVTNGKTYFYEVSAVDAGGATPMSNEASATPGGAVLTAPVLKAAAGAMEVDLSWSLVPDAASYNVYRSNVAGAEGSAAFVTGAAGPTYSDTQVKAGDHWFYKVAAVSKTGVGALSNEASATPGEPPLPATIAMAASSVFGQILLTWENVQKATGYNLYRSTTAGGEGLVPMTLILPGANGTSNYTDTAVTAGSMYYYQVAPVNADGEGALSTELTAEPAAGLSAYAPLIPYFSGTNSSFGPPGGLYTKTGGSDLTSVTVTLGPTGPLGPTIVAGTNQPIGNAWDLEINSNWFFDSTHFGGDAVIPFQIQSTDNNPQGAEHAIASGFGTNFNRAFLMSNRTWGIVPPGGAIGDVAFQAFDDGDDRLEHMNNFLVPTLAELKPDILNGLPNFNVIYAITHCAPGEMGDCQSIPTSGPQSILYAQNDPNHGMTIAASVTGKGNQLPPTPGYRFVFVLGCEAAGTTDIVNQNGQDILGAVHPDHSLAQAFGVDNVGPTDAGFLGFQTLVEIDQHNVDWCDAVLDHLKAGATLDDAIKAASHDVKTPPDGWDESATALKIDPNGLAMPGQAVAVIYGDPNMTFFDRLYGGAFVGQWYTGEGFAQPGG